MEIYIFSNRNQKIFLERKFEKIYFFSRFDDTSSNFWKGFTNTATKLRKLLKYIISLGFSVCFLFHFLLTNCSRDLFVLFSSLTSVWRECIWIFRHYFGLGKLRFGRAKTSLWNSNKKYWENQNLSILQTNKKGRVGISNIRCHLIEGNYLTFLGLKSLHLHLQISQQKSLLKFFLCTGTLVFERVSL